MQGRLSIGSFLVDPQTVSDSFDVSVQTSGHGALPALGHLTKMVPSARRPWLVEPLPPTVELRLQPRQGLKRVHVKRIVNHQRCGQSHDLCVVWMRGEQMVEDLTTGATRQDSWLIADRVAYHVMAMLIVVLTCMVVVSLS